MGYEHCTPIQAAAIPEILANKDLIACAQTGTGKTAAFLLPLMSKVLEKPSGYIKSLIIVPTRELAKQIDDAIIGYGYFSSIESIAIYGGGKGENWNQNADALKSGVDILVATPGRLQAHMKMGYVDFSKIDVLILDEADKMMEMGFHDDIMQIVKVANPSRQTLMFSATMPNRIRSLAKDILKNPKEINFGVSKPAANVTQTLYCIKEEFKPDILFHLLKEREVDRMIIFTSRKSNVNTIVRLVKKAGFDAEAVHSDRTQEEREKALIDFKNKQVRVLVATDILSRGIDIENLSHVVNFEVPSDAEDYVHRIGRTARAASKGEAITLISPKEQYTFSKIESLFGETLPKGELPQEMKEMGFEYTANAGEKPSGKRKPNKRKNFRPKKSGSSNSQSSRGRNNN
ncbi:MAG: DEAD/DEAH box helicase [Cyclobacteriaceae bacterium]|nr:DEAD/DEAH box helicase [Cyclobacteriaceae bacterium]